MCEGGIYDHLGGGFSRYSVDAQWLVPHFEKMLYDNAQLLELLALAWQRSGAGLFAERARETVGWLQREMVTGEGAFSASLDADSEGEEGKFYVWSLAEIEAVLGPDAADFAVQYDVTPGGNFEGHNILNRLKHLPRSMSEGGSGAAAAALPPEAAARFSMLRGKLLKEREKRIRPGLDDKVLADWNGLMISALVNAGVILDEPSWLDMARRAFDFIAQQMTRGDRLGHSWRAGQLLLPGLASDYAAMIRAALALYEATGEGAFLERALAWQHQLDAHYADRDSGAYYLTADDAGDLVVRPHSTADDATPNANSVAAGNLVRLAALTGDHQWREKADRLIEGIISAQPRNLFAHVALLNALDLRLRARRDRRHRPGRGSLRASRAEAALPRPHRAARAQRRGAAADAPGAGEAESDERQRRLRLRGRDLLAAGQHAGPDRRRGRRDARRLIVLIPPLKGEGGRASASRRVGLLAKIREPPPRSSLCEDRSSPQAGEGSGRASNAALKAVLISPP